MENIKKTWFEIDGKLEPIDFKGPSYFRYPLDLALKVIEEFCIPRGSVFDPFAGFGTTLVAAQQTGRSGIGFELDLERATFAQSRIRSPGRVIHDRIQNLAKYNLPKFDLIFTSPPYASFESQENDPKEKYTIAFETIFCSFKSLMHDKSNLVIEISNVKDNRGALPIAFLATAALMKHYRFHGEIVRCNTGSEAAGPGYDHSYLLVFTLT
ncbi:MAG: DNA methyltransferase [Pseudobdellovibrionaceae bacterium]